MPRSVPLDWRVNRFTSVQMLHGLSLFAVANEAGEDQPQPWRIRGCEDAIAYDAQAAVTQAFAVFAERLGRPALYAMLEARAFADGTR